MRILGITLPEEKNIAIGLTYVYGIGHSLSHRILSGAKVEGKKKVKEITADEEAKIKKQIDGLKLEGDLKREVSGNIKRLKDVKCYRGVRHTRNLPTRGQRTKTNSRTRRGNIRKTMGTGRRALDKK